MKSLVYFTHSAFDHPCSGKPARPPVAWRDQAGPCPGPALYHRAADRTHGGRSRGHGHRTGPGYRFRKLHRAFRLDQGPDRSFRGTARQKSARPYQPARTASSWRPSACWKGSVIAFFLQMFYGSVPFFSLLAGRILPQALYTGVLGAVLLKLHRQQGRHVGTDETKRSKGVIDGSAAGQPRRDPEKASAPGGLHHPCLLVVLFIRLWYLQAVKGEYYHEQAESNRITTGQAQASAGHYLRPQRQAARRECACLRHLADPGRRAGP